MQTRDLMRNKKVTATQAYVNKEEIKKAKLKPAKSKNTKEVEVQQTRGETQGRLRNLHQNYTNELTQTERNTGTK